MDRADAATWDRLAPRYGAQERLELRAIDTALRLAAPGPGERLVDLGTGAGLLLRRLAALPERPGQAIGIDRSAGMLARVGTLPAGWSVLRGDARAVPLPDGHAAVVTCAYVLQLLREPERRAVLGEALRLLGGDPARPPRRRHGVGRRAPRDRAADGSCAALGGLGAAAPAGAACARSTPPPTSRRQASRSRIASSCRAADTRRSCSPPGRPRSRTSDLAAGILLTRRSPDRARMAECYRLNLPISTRFLPISRIGGCTWL